MAGILLIFGACTLWALDTLIRYPLLFSGVSPWTIVWLEHAILVVAMAWWIVPALARARFSRRTWLGFLVIGGLGSGLGTVAFTQAFALINPSVVILIQKLQPAVAVTLAALLLRERIDRRFLGAFALCLAGSLMIAWRDLAPAFDGAAWGGEEGAKLLAGYACTLFAVLAWGSATVFGKQLSMRGMTTAELMGGRFLTGFLVLTPCLFLFGAPSAAADPAVASKVALMVAIAGLGGMALYYLGMKRLPARTTAIAEMFFPVAAVTVNWFAPQIEATLSPLQIAGAAVLLAGSAFVALTQADDGRADSEAVIDGAAGAPAARGA